MGKGTQINVKLSEETLEKWDNHRKEVGFSSRAEFIRFAVNREIDGRETDSNAEIDTEPLKEIQGAISDLSNQMQSMESRIEELSNAVSQDPEIEELADTIFTLLPDEKPGSEAWEYEKMQLERDQETKKLTAWEGTPEGLSEATEKPVRKVITSLDKLREETHLIERQETQDGNIQYWKEV